MKKLILSLMVYLSVFAVFGSEYTLEIEGSDGPGKGKTIVLISGDEEYRTEESMPMLAKILAKKHGYKCIVLFAWDREGKYIDPNNQSGLRGLSNLDKADLMIIGTRFRRLNKMDCVHLAKFLNEGKPIIGIRTSTHAFSGKEKIGGSLSQGAFGSRIIGEKWVSHHGRHKKEGARGVIEEINAKHPILKNVKDIFAPSDVYEVRQVKAERGDTILLRGQVTKTLDPKSQAVEGKKNMPMQALAWLHPYTSPTGKKGTTFATTMGSSVDFVNEDLRRLIVNATYFLTKITVPVKADVTYVDPFYPSFYGFIKDKNYWKGEDMQAADYGLGKSPAKKDFNAPAWPFRPIKK